MSGDGEREALREREPEQGHQDTLGLRQQIIRKTFVPAESPRL